MSDPIQFGFDPHILRPSNLILPEPAQTRELIEAAIAVNDAPTLAEAFQVLADTGAALLGCDRLTIVAWNDDLSVGTICADTGTSFGELVSPIDDSAENIRTESVYSGPAQADGGELQNFAFVVRVPLITASGVATFHALWREPLGDDEANGAVELVRMLTRLTSIAERSLREGVQLRLGSVLDGVADGVVVSKGTIATPNAAARALLAIPEGVEFKTALFNPRNLEGEPFELAADDVPGAKSMARGDEESRRFRIRVTALDGRELVLDGSISPAPDGAVVVFRDVTAEHEREVLNERYLYALFNSMPIPLTVGHAASRQVISANQAFLDLTGYELDEIVGVTPPYPWWDDAEEEEKKGGFVPGSVVRRVYRRKDGRPLPAEVLSHGVPGDDGKVALLLGVITDLSEKRRLDQQLVQSGKLAAIGELAAGVAHEINNPLFAILGLTEFLLNEIEAGSKAHKRLELIQQTGLEIKEIVRALLDFARENAEERLVVALDDVVRSTVDLIRRTNAHKGVEVVDSYTDGEALVNASPNQLKQIFLNLIANARQAMPDGGIVRVEVHRDGEHLLAVVSDNGPGIEPTVLERIFDPFFTTKRLTGGTGLGLSVSLGIAESHGGSLTATSELGHGATFTLRLPIAEDGGPTA